MARALEIDSSGPEMISSGLAIVSRASELKSSGRQMIARASDINPSGLEMNSGALAMIAGGLTRNSRALLRNSVAPEFVAGALPFISNAGVPTWCDLFKKSAIRSA
jgi:hypothetical protein